jgi:hypothetical protein
VDLAALALFRPDQMLRRYISTAKRTMTRKAAKKRLTKEARLENEGGAIRERPTESKRDF